MIRIVAREIAVHLLFELNFGGRTAEQVLEGSLTRERFQTLAEEDPLYREFPNEKQLRYIRELVQGAYDHRPELDEAISRYAIGWSFSRLPRMAVAAMRCAMYEMLYMPQIPPAASINAALENYYTKTEADSTFVKATDIVAVTDAEIQALLADDEQA